MDVKQLSRQQLMSLWTDAARAELKERNERCAAGRRVIREMLEREEKAGR